MRSSSTSAPTSSLRVPKPPVRGKELQKSVITFARSKRWHCVHFPSVETKQGWRTGVAADAKGWPDIILVRDRLVAIEIKGDGDSLSAEQREWGDRLQRAGVEYYVVRPKDWRNGTVDEILR